MAVLKLPLSKYFSLLLCSQESDYEIKEMRYWGVWEINVYTELVNQHERNRPFGIPRHRWEDNIKAFRPIKLSSLLQKAAFI